MRSKLVVVFMFLACTTWAQLNEVDAQGRKQGQWGKKYEGKTVFKYMGTFKDDKPVGKFYYRYPNNKIKAVIIHSENSNRSEAYMYHENGKLMSYGIYRGEAKDSIWTYYGPSERLSVIETYKDGELHGKKTIYYVPQVAHVKSHQIAQVYTYENGVLNGETKAYFDNGNIKEEGTYRNGKKHGVYRKYHPNGKLEFYLRYKNGEFDGYQITYDGLGKEIGRKYFVKGKELKGQVLKNYLKKLEEKGIKPNH